MISFDFAQDRLKQAQHVRDKNHVTLSPSKGDVQAPSSGRSGRENRVAAVSGVW